MSAGDLFIFITLSSTGVDIQGLWENSKSVSPPHHLNFFNPYSINPGVVNQKNWLKSVASNYSWQTRY